MVVRAVIMIISYYTINFATWNILLNYDWLSIPSAFLLTYVVLLFIVLAVYGGHLLQEWKRLKRRIDSPLKFLLQLFVHALLVFGLTILIVFLIEQLFEIAVVPSQRPDLEYISKNVPRFLSLFIFTLIAPVIEEVSFREAFIGWVDDYNDQLIFYMSLASIFFFILIYILNHSEILYYLPFSFLLTDFYLRHGRNVWASITLHIFIKLIFIIFI